MSPPPVISGTFSAGAVGAGCAAGGWPVLTGCTGAPGISPESSMTGSACFLASSSLSASSTVRPSGNRSSQGWLMENPIGGSPPLSVAHIRGKRQKRQLLGLQNKGGKLFLDVKKGDRMRV